MQYKKDELKITILSEAEIEFLNKGYNNASLRQIAKRSGTTIGNLYNYFKSKGELFDELVKNEYNAFVSILENHSNIEMPAVTGGTFDYNAWRCVLYDFLQQFMPIFTKRFLILLDLSEGTKYENTKTEFIDFIRKHFLKHAECSNKPLLLQFAQLIAVQILSGIIYIIKNFNTDEIKHQLICELFLFNIIGVIGITK